MNPTFLGWGLFLQMKCGLHHHAAADRPVERFVNQAELEKLGRLEVPRERRPFEDMMVIQHRELAGYIGEEDADVRKAAEAAIRQYFADWETKKLVPDEKRSIRNHNSQARTRYFLRDVLRDKHYSRKFCGQTHGRDGAYRDYLCNSVIEFEKREHPLPQTVRADPLERAVIGVLKAVFSDLKDIKQRIAVVAARIIAEQPDAVERARLQEQLAENKKTMRQLQNTFTAEELGENPQRVTELREERKRIEKRLAIAEAAHVKLDAAKLTADIIECLSAFETGLDGDGYERLRMLVNTVCPRITIDLETYEAEVMVALPTMLLWSPSSDWRMMCGTFTREVLSQGIAHRDSWLILGVYHLKPTIWTPPPKLGRVKPLAYDWSRIDDQPPEQEQRRAA